MLHHTMIDLEIRTTARSSSADGDLPVNAQNWGRRQVRHRRHLPSGSSLTIKVGTGDYDILVVDCKRQTIAEADGVSIDSPGPIP